MNILVLLKHVPDLVEELEVDEDTGQLDRTFIRMTPGELDEHALEEAILLKERHGGTVTVATLDTGDVDESLFTAVAKGADRVIKVVGDGFDEGVDSRAAAAIFDQVLAETLYDLILTGTQAVDDLDGSVGSLLAARRDLPFVGYVIRVEPGEGNVKVAKEYPGGLVGELELDLPAVVGIQAAEQAPRYVVTSRVMDAMKTATIDELDAPNETLRGFTAQVRMSVPEVASRAEMIPGAAGDVADALVALMGKRGIL